MDNKYFKILMKAYVDDFKRSCEVSDMLGDFGLYFTDENNPLVRAVEEIFSDYEDLCFCLIDFAMNGEVEVIINNKNIVCHNIDELYSVFFG